MKSWLRSRFAKAAAWSVLSIGVVFALFWLHLLNFAGVDDWTERRFLKYASLTSSPAQDPRLKLIYIDPKKPDGLGAFDDGITANQQWRSHHAALLEKLSAGNARMVAFDLSFPAPDLRFDKDNQQFVAAIRDFNGKNGMDTLVGFERDMDVNAALEAVLPRARMGLVSIPEMTFDASSDQYLARVLLAESTVKPGRLGTEERVSLPLPMPLAMYLADRRPTDGDASLTLDPSRGALVVHWEKGGVEEIEAEIRTCVIGKPGCALPAGALPGATMLRRAVMPLWMGRALTFTTVPYSAVLNQASLADNYEHRVVIVGARTEGEVQQIGPGAPKDVVYGMDIHARVFSDLVTRTYPRHASAWLQLLGFALVLVSGVAARLYMPIKVVKIPIEWLKDFPLPVGFFMVAALWLIVAAVIFGIFFVFFDLGYHLLALLAGYYAVPALAKLVEPVSVSAPAAGQPAKPTSKARKKPKESP